MLLCLDVGNTHIHGGVFEGDDLRIQFRRGTYPIGSSDEIGLFLRSVLRENGFDPERVTRVAICSVVPPVAYPLRSACVKYFKVEPLLLQPGIKTGLKIKYRNPVEVGSDRIACAIAASQARPDADAIIIDCGTATTVDAVNAAREYLGGVIFPGLSISVDALAGKTARLPTVEIARPESVLGRSTVESIQSGVYFGQAGAMKHIIAQMVEGVFDGRRPWVVGTGGFCRLFENEGIFDEIVPDLVLRGLWHAERMNRGEPAVRAPRPRVASYVD
jgi:type III pantothenate kinase